MQSALILDELMHIPDYEECITQTQQKLERLYRIPVKGPAGLSGAHTETAQVNGRKVEVRIRSTAKGSEIAEIAELEECLAFYKLALKRARQRRENLENSTTETEFVARYLNGEPKKDLSEHFGISRPDRKMLGLIKKCFHVD